MKILWLAPIPFIDDNNSHPAPWIMNLGKLLIDNGHELTIINYNSNIKNEIKKLKYENIEIIYIKTPKLKLDFLTLYQLRIYKVKKYLKNIINKFDILHIHGTEHQYEVMAKDLNIPKLISIQGIMEEYIKFIPKKRYKQLLEWKLSAYYESKYISQYDNFSCRTKWDSNHIRLKNPNANIFMIWEVIRRDFFDDYFSLEKNKILFVGGKNPIKGLKELLFAYNNSIQDLDTKIIVLGNCSKNDIKNIIDANDLVKIDINNIECRGMQDSSGMIKAYKESYCLVHPTYIDNSPNSICEAQIAGLPVIATNVGGVNSLIENLKTGLLTNNTIKDLENKIKQLLQNNHLREEISINSRNIARGRHSQKKILDDTLKMYHKILDEK